MNELIKALQDMYKWNQSEDHKKAMEIMKQHQEEHKYVMQETYKK